MIIDLWISIKEDSGWEQIKDEYYAFYLRACTWVRQSSLIFNMPVV